MDGTIMVATAGSVDTPDPLTVWAWEEASFDLFYAAYEYVVASRDLPRLNQSQVVKVYQRLAEASTHRFFDRLAQGDSVKVAYRAARRHQRFHKLSAND